MDSRRHQGIDASSDGHVAVGVVERVQPQAASGNRGPLSLAALESESDATLRGLLETALGTRYTILRPLGTGGMGTVYLVRDRQHDRPLALKALLPEVAAVLGGPRDAERFLREIRISARLCHPHIVALYDSGHAGGLLYYTMPYVPGESLRERLRRERQLPLRDAITLARQVASALDYAHRQGVIHRDVKPENILLHEGEALIADFGIARALHAQRQGSSPTGVADEDSRAPEDDGRGANAGDLPFVSPVPDDRITATGLALGTPLYMSPEQAAGEAVDDRTDIYALGCVVYEMLAGEPPFTGSTVNAILTRKLAEDVLPLAARRKDLPASVDGVVRQALRSLPADRFKSAEEFASALERVASSVTGQPRGGIARLRTYRGALFFLAVVAVASGVLTVEVATRDPGTAGPASASPPIRAIALLPIETDSSQLSVADEIHARMVNELARISALRVTGRMSSMRFRGSTKPPAVVAKELQVDGLVESSLTVGHDSLAVLVRIRSARNGALLWGRLYTADARHLERLQKDLARDVVAYLQLPLTAAESQRLSRYRLTDPRARAAYQRGRVMSASYDQGRFEKSIAAFEEAIRLDPDDPAPYVGLAEVYQTMVGAGHVSRDTMPPAEAFRRAKQLVQRALELDPDNAEAHVVLGGIRHMWDWDWKGAEREFATAIRNSPGSASAHFQYGAYLQSIGLIDSGIVELRRAASIDPLSPMILGQLAWAHIWAGQPDSALYWTRMALDLDPNLGPVHWVHGMAFSATGQHDSAIAEQSRLGGRNRGRLVDLAVAYAAAGRMRDFERTVALLPDRARGWAAAKASRFTGDRDAAIRTLERAVEEHMSWVAHIRGDPAYRHLASDPRYQALLQRIGLPPLPPAAQAGAGATTPP